MTAELQFNPTSNGYTLVLIDATGAPLVEIGAETQADALVSAAKWIRKQFNTVDA